MPTKQLAELEVWFVTGSQHLYGPETLKQVAANSQEIARSLDAALPAKVVFKPVLTDPEAVRRLILAANADPNCAGLVLWMHTFSPAKMWIGGLSQCAKPICHLHTQFNRDLPWAQIDMDFMNLNQAAHGDREAGHLHARLKLRRKVVVGHWSDPQTLADLEVWVRVARGWAMLQGAKLARFGDNMRQVAVTEGDKVAAEARFGFSVNGFGVGDLVQTISEVSETDVEALVQRYVEEYEGVDRTHPAVRDAAKQELGMRAFLEAGDFVGFTTTFEDLHGLYQLPGLACQRLMAQGYGFGAEGDWKTAAMLYLAKQIVDGLPGGTSFMEDYTYHLDTVRPQVLGAHMLEICPSIASSRPRLEVHPLGIGGKADPARLVFDAPAGTAINVSLVDLGNRFRLIANTVRAVEPPPLPKLPVARALWEPEPDFRTGLAAWIYAGGAHHTVYSYPLGLEHVRDLAEIAGIELLEITAGTSLSAFRDTIRTHDVAYGLSVGGF